MVMAKQKSINIIDIHTQKKKEFKHRTKDSHPIIREQKRKGRKKDVPAHLQKNDKEYTQWGCTALLVKTSGIYGLGCGLGTGRGSTWGRWQSGEPQGWGRPGRLDRDSTSSHLSGLPSRRAALPFGGGGGGFMHHPRPLISSFWFLKCFLERPSNWFLFMF